MIWLFHMYFKSINIIYEFIDWLKGDILPKMMFIALVPGFFSLGVIAHLSPRLSPLVMSAIQGTEPGIHIHVYISLYIYNSMYIVAQSY